MKRSRHVLLERASFERRDDEAFVTTVNPLLSPPFSEEES